jgi:hypothetical protein
MKTSRILISILIAIMLLSTVQICSAETIVDSNGLFYDMSFNKIDPGKLPLYYNDFTVGLPTGENYESYRENVIDWINTHNNGDVDYIAYPRFRPEIWYYNRCPPTRSIGAWISENYNRDMTVFAHINPTVLAVLEAPPYDGKFDRSASQTYLEYTKGKNEIAGTSSSNSTATTTTNGASMTVMGSGAAASWGSGTATRQVQENTETNTEQTSDKLITTNHATVILAFDTIEIDHYDRNKWKERNLNETDLLNVKSLGTSYLLISLADFQENHSTKYGIDYEIKDYIATDGDLESYEQLNNGTCSQVRVDGDSAERTFTYGVDEKSTTIDENTNTSTSSFSADIGFAIEGMGAAYKWTHTTVDATTNAEIHGQSNFETMKLAGRVNGVSGARMFSWNLYTYENRFYHYLVIKFGVLINPDGERIP